MRKILIFGNGLGRSLDNGFFNLQSALAAAWNNSGVLTNQQKALIWQCLPPEVIETSSDAIPDSEAQLDRLQRVLAACDEISKYEANGGESWLSELGKGFPTAIRSYIHHAASNFHETDLSLPADFVQTLKSWLLESRSHVATLNYDGLLYRSFIGTELFSGYSCMLDGFVPHFDPSNLDRFTPSRQSYYLHLHGSPLYYTATDGSIRKCATGDLPFLQGHASTHLVLTHVDHKASVISASPLLREYWRRLDIAMQESDAVMLFGYGGGDVHLNQMISRHFRAKQVEIVERRKAGVDPVPNSRFAYWNSKLGVPETFIYWYDNILSHRTWSWVRQA